MSTATIWPPLRSRCALSCHRHMVSGAFASARRPGVLLLEPHLSCNQPWAAKSKRISLDRDVCVPWPRPAADTCIDLAYSARRRLAAQHHHANNTRITFKKHIRLKQGRPHAGAALTALRRWRSARAACAGAAPPAQWLAMGKPTTGKRPALRVQEVPAPRWRPLRCEERGSTALAWGRNAPGARVMQHASSFTFNLL